MKYNKISRRMFLQGSGTALAIPFLPSLFESRAFAAGTVLPKYLHINSSICLPRETVIPLYANPYPSYPQPAGTNPNSVPWLVKDADTSYQSLADIIKFQGKISWALDEKWNPFASRMNLITNAHAYVSDNLYNSTISSTASSSKTGTVGYPNANGPAKGYSYSVDWLIEQALYKNSPSPAIPTLRIHPLTVAGENCYLGFCYGTINGVDTRIPMINTLKDLNAMFGGLPNQTVSGSRKSRIDSVLEDYNRLMNHRRISNDDKARLSSAVDLWHSVETKTNLCSIPSANANETNWSLVHSTCMDAVVASLACGLTRNVSYGLIQGGDNLQQIEGAADPRIGNQVDPVITNPYYDTIRWRSNLVTSFLGKLDSALDENGQSLLNSCITTWCHTNADNQHGVLGHAMILVSGQTSKFDLGYHVNAGAAPVNRFHLTNMLAMGLTLADIEKNGRAGFGEYSPTTMAAAGGEQTEERDAKTNDSSKLPYNYSKRDHFFTDTERRKAFPYLKVT